MEIFRKRPLCMILCMMLGGFALFWRLDGLSAVLVFSATAISDAVFLFLRRRTGRFVPVLLFCVLLSFLLSHLYFGLWFPADRRIKGEREIEATVTDIDYADASRTVFTVKTEPIDDIPLSRYRLRILLTRGGSTLTPGERIRFQGKILPLLKEDGSTKDLSAYADGCSGSVEIDNYTSLFRNESDPRRSLSALRTEIKGYLETVGKDASPLLCALFLGDKSDLSGTAKLDFRRIGISHLLAVSGMHLAILTAFLHRLLLIFGVGKKSRIALSSLFSLFYMALTGFCPSVLRAGVMLLIASLLFLFASASDSVTTLALSVFIICLFTPYAIFDLSLLLSALATLGILAAPKPKAEGKIRPLRRLLLTTLLSVLFSFFAVGATLSVTVFSFGRLSLLSLFSTLLFGVLIELLMISGILALPFGFFLPTEIPLSFLSSKILRLAGIFSDLKSIYPAADFLPTKILTVLFTLGFCLFLVLKIKRKRLVVGGLFFLLLAVFVSAGICSRSVLSVSGAEYSVGESGDEFIVATEKGHTTLIAGKNSDGAEVAAFLSDGHITELDSLVLPAYSGKLPAFLRKLTSALKVRSVTLPIPQSNRERFHLHAVETVLQEGRVSCRLVAPQSTFLESGILFCFHRQEENSVVFTFSASDHTVACFSDGTAKDDTVTKDALLRAQAVIFGESGSAYKTPYTFPVQDYPATRVVLSSEGVTVSDRGLSALFSRGGILLRQPIKAKLY